MSLGAAAAASNRTDDCPRARRCPSFGRLVEEAERAVVERCMCSLPAWKPCDGGTGTFPDEEDARSTGMLPHPWTDRLITAATLRLSCWRRSASSTGIDLSWTVKRTDWTASLQACSNSEINSSDRRATRAHALARRLNLLLISARHSQPISRGGIVNAPLGRSPDSTTYSPIRQNRCLRRHMRIQFAVKTLRFLLGSWQQVNP